MHSTDSRADQQTRPADQSAGTPSAQSRSPAAHVGSATRRMEAEAEATRLRSTLGVTFGYFLLDLVALTTPPESPLDIGQSVALLMSLALYCIMRPLNSVPRRSTAEVICVLLAGSTVLDVIDAAFNIDADRALSVIPATVDIVVSVVYLILLGVDMWRAGRIGAAVAAERDETVALV